MIESIDLSNFKSRKKGRAVFDYARSIPFFKNVCRRKIKEIQFKTGLNILFGPNGSGKSTILSMIAKYLAADQGGMSTVTHTWVEEIVGMFDNDLLLNYMLRHDGQAILYANPTQDRPWESKLVAEGLMMIFTRTVS